MSLHVGATRTRRVAARLRHLHGHVKSRPRQSDPELLAIAQNYVTAELTPIEAAKRLAARTAVDDYVKDGFKIGVGSGSTIVYAVERLAERAKEEGLRIECVPTSFQSEQLVLDAGLTLASLSTCPHLDVAIDGADEVDENLNCIKGKKAHVICVTYEVVCKSRVMWYSVETSEKKQLQIQLCSCRHSYVCANRTTHYNTEVSVCYMLYQRKCHYPKLSLYASLLKVAVQHRPRKK